MYYGDCYSPTDLVKVAVDDIYGFPKSNNQVKCYSRPVYGLINYKGEIVLDINYYSIVPAVGDWSIISVQNMAGKYGVIDLNGHIIVPFGKYCLRFCARRSCKSVTTDHIESMSSQTTLQSLIFRLSTTPIRQRRQLATHINTCLLLVPKVAQRVAMTASTTEV